jgi:hypothetical protein
MSNQGCASPNAASIAGLSHGNSPSTHCSLYTDRINRVRLSTLALRAPVCPLPSRLLSSATTQRVASNCAMPMQSQVYDGFLPVDSHLKSERKLDAGPLAPSSDSPMRTLKWPKLAVERTKPRPRSPGNTLGLQPALSSTQAITSATNRSLAERPKEGLLQQRQPTSALENYDEYFYFKGTNLV